MLSDTAVNFCKENPFKPLAADEILAEFKRPEQQKEQVA